jgi:homopolymeric O-antigen transport system ATP-binding protein
MSVSTVAVRASELGKRYRIGTRLDPDASLAASIARGVKAPFLNFVNLRRLRHFDDAAEDSADVIWAFRDVSFEAHPGEVLGVIGRNGAGKSTLLKVLSRITEPTEGEAEIHGRVSSLLEVGAGFHGDLTGRDNVFLKGTLLGMTRREVAARFDEIVGFAELEQFIDTPVKRFSSGMYVRLAFSVAAHLDPDVLIADEVLAVGDAEFQRRSIGTMRSAAEELGRTVIFVSHDLSVVASLCTRAIWLDRGRLRAAGDVDEVIDEYMHSLQHEESRDLAHRTDRTGSGAVRATSVSVQAAGGPGRGAVPAGEPVEIRISYEAPSGLAPGPITATVVIETLLRERVATLSTEFTGDRLESPPSSGTLTCVVDDFPINEGDYMCTVRLDAAGKMADWIADTTRFRVDPTSFYTGNAHPGPKGGRMLLRHRWRIDD